MDGGSASETAPAKSYPIPKASMSSVEFPGPVGSLQAAESAAHPDDIDMCFNGDKSLELSLRPGQVYSIPVKGSALPIQRLLLRVRRRKRRSPGEDNEGLFTATVVGPVHSTVRFRAMADYQFSPDTQGPVAKLVESMRELDYEAILSHSFPEPSESFTATGAEGNLRSTLEIFPPPLSSSKAIASTHNFRGNNASQLELVPDEINGGLRRRLVQKQKYVGSAMQTLAHNSDVKVPLGPVKAGKDTKNANTVPALHSKLKQLIDARPVWIRTALVNQLSPSERQQFNNNKAYLPEVAYTFADGPFRGLIIRFGYDPSKDPEAKIYQRVQFNNTAAVQSARRIASRPPNMGAEGGESLWEANQKRRAELGQRGPLDPSKGHLFDGRELHRARGEYQWVDVSDPLVHKLVQASVTAKRCDAVDGWFLPAQHQSLKAILRKKFRHLEQDLASEDDDFEDLVAEFEAGAQSDGGTRGDADLPEDDSDDLSEDELELPIDEGVRTAPEPDRRHDLTARNAGTSSSSRYRSALMPRQQMTQRLPRDVQQDADVA